MITLVEPVAKMDSVRMGIDYLVAIGTVVKVELVTVAQVHCFDN